MAKCKLCESRLSPPARAALERLKEQWAAPPFDVGPVPAVDECIEKMFERYVDRMARLIEEGKSVSEVRDVADAARARTSIREQVLGIYDDDFDRLDREMTEQAIEAVLATRESVVRGIEAEEASREATRKHERESSINRLFARAMGR